jgi:2'-5' RNA ligase
MCASNKPDPNTGVKESKQKNIRVFIAVNLPDQVIFWLSGIQKELKSLGLPVQWTRPENTHLTLKFLGEIPKTDVAGVCQSVEISAARFAPFEIFSKGVGVFPGLKRPRVLWTGIAGRTDLLGDLQRALDLGLNVLGFPKDDRPFTGHLTLGRFKSGHQGHDRHSETLSDLLIEMMKQYQPKVSEPFLAGAVNVIKSDLTPAGPIYTTIATARLT